MHRAELVEALRRAQVPDALYDIPGVHDVPLEPDASFFLRPEAEEWVVGHRERGRDSVLDRFATESEACDFLYATLIREAPTGAPGGADRVRDVFAHRAEIQQEAWRAFERRRQEPDEGPP
jgi:hypothetical protein